MQPFLESNRKRSLLLLVFGVISLVGLLGRALYLIVIASLNLSRATLTINELGPYALETLSMLLCASLLLPLLIGSARHLQGRDLPAGRLPVIRMRFLLMLSIAWVVMLTIASLLSERGVFGWLFSAPAFLLGILIPVVTLTWIAAGGLAQSSRRRMWAAFGLGMTGGTTLALLLEYSLVIVAVLAAAMAAVFQPQLMQTLEQVQDLATRAGNPEELLTVLAPWLVKPWIFLLLLLFTAGLGPLIEEAVKPLAVWMLGRRLRSTGEGFALGALSGAGFALLEGLMAASGYAAAPAIGLPARLASSLMHITLSGMMGWAIASAYLQKRRLRLVTVYLLCVTLHGLWNGSAMLAVYGALRIAVSGVEMPDLPSTLLLFAGLSLLCMTFTIIALGLPLFNSRLRHDQDDIIVPPTPPSEREPNGLDSQSD